MEYESAGNKSQDREENQDASASHAYGENQAKRAFNFERNKDVILNFGLIARGKLRDIENLQRFIVEKISGLRVVYCTVTAKKLKLIRLKEVDGSGK